MKTIAQLCDDILNGETVLAAHRIEELRRVMQQRYPDAQTHIWLAEMGQLADRVSQYIVGVKMAMRDE